MPQDTKEYIQNEVDKTIESLENCEILKANPFLFTRIMAHHNREENKKGRRILHFSIPHFALLTTLILLNILSFIYLFPTEPKISLKTESFIGSFTEDFYLSAQNDILSKIQIKE